jgi:predicted esterase
MSPSSTLLLALHGFTQNGSVMRVAVAPIAAQLESHVRVECPDGPTACSEASVARLQSVLGGDRVPAPHCAWFDATDDGREYRGFDKTLARLTGIIERSGAQRVGLLGFSQGAILGASLAALAARGRFPKLDFAVLVAGRIPRADELKPLFDAPLPLPSLHVWGERDKLSGPGSTELTQAFAAENRTSVVWPGPHVIPTRGPGSEAIVEFIKRYA